MDVGIATISSCPHLKFQLCRSAPGLIIPMSASKYSTGYFLWESSDMGMPLLGKSAITDVFIPDSRKKFNSANAILLPSLILFFAAPPEACAGNSRRGPDEFLPLGIDKRVVSVFWLFIFHIFPVYDSGPRDCPV